MMLLSHQAILLYEQALGSTNDKDQIFAYMPEISHNANIDSLPGPNTFAYDEISRHQMFSP